MGLGYCSGCKEYYYCTTTEINKSTQEILNSRSSIWAKFNNPFFPKGVDLNEFIVLNTEKDLEEKEKKIEEEKEKEEEEEKEFNRLKQIILEEEVKKRKNIEENGNNIIDNIDNINNEDNPISISLQEEKKENAKINSTLENMCILGDITKKEIFLEKKKNPEKFIETSEALKLKEEDEDLFVLGLLSNNLEEIGIETAIEKDINEDKQDAAATCLQYITSGLGLKKKYDLKFDFDEERNNELLNDKNEFEIFKKNLKKKLSKDYNIPEDKIIVTFPQKGSFHVQVIFQSDLFNDLNLEDFKQKFKEDSEFKELQNLKEIHSDVILGGGKLSQKFLDKRGNRVSGWGENEYRGGRKYNPPLGWIGIGLNVLNKYENDEWIGCNNSPGEWCVAYHGVGRFLESSDNVKDVTGKIIKGTFKAGQNQVHRNCENINKPGTKVGEGVYCTPNVDTALQYSGKSEINGKIYQTVLMVRVKPKAIRECEDSGDYWVVNGTTDEIRPYRILYKCFS